MSGHIEAEPYQNIPTVADTIFNIVSENCKYYHVGFDEDRVACDTCRHKDNIPAGCSWGICDKDHCPIFAKMNGGNE